MEDLFDILDSTEAPVSEVKTTTSTELSNASDTKVEDKKFVKKEGKKDLWEDEIEAVKINKENLLRFNRMFTIASFGEVPGETIVLIDQLSKSLHSKGFTFRFDGHIRDKASTAGYKACKDRSETYLPWKSFNKEVTPKLTRPSEKAYGYASGLHTKFNDLPPTVRAMLARNIHVVMGDECNTPVNLCIIYTADGAETKQDIKYATTGNMAFFIYACEALDIPVFNLKNDSAKERIVEFLNSMIKNG